MKLKKIQAFAIVFLMVLSFPVPAKCSLVPEEEKAVPIVMYHNVLKNKALLGKFVITPEELENDLFYLDKNGYNTITMEDLINFVDGGQLPENPVMLTFDDGDFAIINYVLPLLEKYDMKAVVSIIGKVTDEYSAENRSDIGRYPNLTWAQVNELIESGHVEIQNHTYNLHHGQGVKKKPGESEEDYKKRLSNDLLNLQGRLKEMVNYDANTVTYPFGLKSDSTDAIVKEMGFLGSLSCNEKINTITSGNPDCLFSLGRFLRPHGIDSDNFFDKFLK